MSQTRPLALSEALDEERRTIGRPEIDQPLSALCISGGGIRSATFGLGAIQGLAERGLLGTFDYLSTVSGGGFVGSWLTRWKDRERDIEKVIPALSAGAPPIPQGEPDPIEHLREYSNYLSPRLGLFSVDAWTLGAIVIRNLFLNWLVFVPLLMAALLLPRLVLSVGRLGDTFPILYPRMAQMVTAAGLSPLLLGASALLFGIAVFHMLRYLPAVGRVEHSEFDFLKRVLLPILLAALAFVTNDAWFTGGDKTKPAADLPQLVSYWELILGAVVSTGMAAHACLVTCRKSLEGRFWSWCKVTAAVMTGGCIAGSAEWLLANFVYPSTTWSQYTIAAVPLLLIAILLAGCMFVGFSSRQLDDDDREWLSRAAAWVLLCVAAWVGFGVVVLFAPVWVMQMPVWGQSMFGAAGGVAGWISAMMGRLSKTPATQEADNRGGLASRAPALAAPVFAVTVLVGLALATDWLLVAWQGGSSAALWQHPALLEGTPVESIVLLGVLLLVFASLMAHFININRFSLHGMYRDRLIRAYLGASNPRRNASKFTGFAAGDNIPMCRLDPAKKPFHVVNVTLNLVSGERLAWQQRKAESFTITPLHCGSGDLGYRPSSAYGGPNGISLGTAVAISGAAASPNMGYHSSPIVSFIMTLFNARLGCWLGNPGAAGDGAWTKDGPTSAIGSLAREAFGLTNNTSQWVYLSDGGHFENLAIYEMVRRRCRHILVLDGGCDAGFTYGDLGNALRKIRIDFKVAVDFDEASFATLRKKEARYAVARIRYAPGDARQDGHLIYVKPMIRGNEPPDVGSYHDDHPDFPHETTANQFFSESQMESYRVLGRYTLHELCEGWDGRDGLAGLAAHLSRDAKATAAAG
jgi:hypothetical protein